MSLFFCVLFVRYNEHMENENRRTEGFAEREIRIFELFHRKWALVAAGNADGFNACTVSWGSLGTLWTRENKSGNTVTVYIHPSRYTCSFLKECEHFTVSFFPEECRQALQYMGSHSGRDEDKTKNAGLHVLPLKESVMFAEAEVTLYCRKIYQHPFAKEGIAEDVREYYRDNPKAYPVDEAGEWQPHWVFVGEILEIRE